MRWSLTNLFYPKLEDDKEKLAALNQDDALLKAVVILLRKSDLGQAAEDLVKEIEQQYMVNASEWVNFADWHSCVSPGRPIPDGPLQFFRPSLGQRFVSRWADLDPQFNVAGLFWREVTDENNFRQLRNNS